MAALFLCSFRGLYGIDHYSDDCGGRMDSFFRLIKRFGVLGLLLVSGLAHADRDADACSAYFVAQHYPSSLSYLRAVPWGMQSDGSHSADCHYSENGQGDYTVFSVSLGPTPPPPENCAIGTQQPGVNWNIGYRTGPSANSPTTGMQTPEQVANQSFCSGKCTYNVDRSPGAPPIDVHSDSTPTPKGYYPVVATANFASTGGTCDPAGPSTPAFGSTSPTMAQQPSSNSPGLDKCPTGTVSGGIDSSGTPICIGSGTSPSTSTSTSKPPVTTSNGDGSTSTATTTTATNADGSTTTTTTTNTTGGTNADGSAKPNSSTTTKNTSPATSGVPGKADAPDSDLCKLHPELTICKNSSVSGSCENVSCEGDAIECAALKVSSKAYCESTASNDMAVLGQQMGSGADPLKASLPTTANASEVNLGQIGGTLDQSGFLGGGSCFSDKTVSVGGRSVSIPFSKACEYLIYLRLAVMLSALLISYKMIGGVILRDL